MNLMKKPCSDTYILDHFEGHLNFLFQLVQKSEIEITEISLKQIIDQFLCKHYKEADFLLDEGAEFIGTASSLLWWKSKKLLPKDEPHENLEETEPELEWDIIPQLIDYCRFKVMAKELINLEQQQSLHYFRGHDYWTASKKHLGVEHLSLEDLAVLFQQILSKARLQEGCIHDETWKVSDKIDCIRLYLNHSKEITFDSLFSSSITRAELVVTFLAVLELMKLGELTVVKTQTPQCFIICRKEYE